jgi:hypothetical protein
MRAGNQYDNNLIRRFNNHQQNPIGYFSNQLFAQSNSILNANIRDPNFYKKMMIEREEQMRKIKRVSDLGMNQNDITDCVICPIKVAKSSADEIQKYVDEMEIMYVPEYIENNWWKNRTNAPYKKILEEKYWNKSFLKEDDLIVHRYTEADKLGLLEEYEKLVEILEDHDKELKKVIYSSSKEAEYKKEFDYVNKYKFRIKFNPKNFDDMKEYYKKEQKKLEINQRRLDEIIAKIDDGDDDITDADIKRLESEFNNYNKKSKVIPKPKISEEERNVDREIKKLMNELENEISEDGEKNPKKTKKKKMENEISIKKTHKISNEEVHNIRIVNNGKKKNVVTSNEQSVIKEEKPQKKNHQNEKQELPKTLDNISTVNIKIPGKKKEKKDDIVPVTVKISKNK